MAVQTLDHPVADWLSSETVPFAVLPNPPQYTSPNALNNEPADRGHGLLATPTRDTEVFLGFTAVPLYFAVWTSARFLIARIAGLIRFSTNGFSSRRIALKDRGPVRWNKCP